MARKNPTSFMDGPLEACKGNLAAIDQLGQSEKWQKVQILSSGKKLHMTNCISTL